MEPARSYPPEPTWSEHERVNLFTEILLQASRDRRLSQSAPPMPSDILLRGILQYHISPDFENLLLPPGKSFSACKSFFDYTSGRRSQPAGFVGQSDPNRPAHVGSKRPYEAIQTVQGSRPIQPKPTTPNILSPSFFQQPLPGLTPVPPSPLGEQSPSLGDQQRKKRGRPTKASVEERKLREAKEAEMARSHSMQSPSAQLGVEPPRHPQMAGPSGYAAAPPSSIVTPPRSQQEEVAGSGSSGGKKRRGRPPKHLQHPSISEPPPLDLAAQSQPRRRSSREASPKSATREEKHRSSNSPRSDTASRIPVPSSTVATETASTPTSASGDDPSKRRRERTWQEITM